MDHPRGTGHDAARRRDAAHQPMPRSIFLSPTQVSHITTRDLDVEIGHTAPDELRLTAVRPGTILPVKEMHLDDGTVYRGAALLPGQRLGSPRLPEVPRAVLVVDIRPGQQGRTRLRLRLLDRPRRRASQ